MSKILRPLRKKPIPEKIAALDVLIQGCAAHPLGAQMAEQLADLEAKRAAVKAAFDAAQQARDEATRLTAAMHVANAALNESYVACMDHAQVVTGGDAQLIAGLGLQSYEGGPGAIITGLAAVTNVTVEVGAFPGTVVVRGEKVRGAKTYVVQSHAEPLTETDWELACGSPKPVITVQQLAVGSTRWFRMAAVGTQGNQGPWSQAVALLIR